MKNVLSGILNLIVAASIIAVPAYAYSQSLEQQDLLQKHEEAHCLAQNIYFEARGSNFADKASVADVVLNRVQDTRYPNTVCDVVRQGNQDSNGNMIRNQCQFSWYCDGKADVATNEDAWEEAMLIAWNMLEHNRYRGLTEGSTHYHATYVTPYWVSDMQLVGRIGSHVYYRWE